MKICSYCNGDSPIEALYCINCGQLFQEMTGPTYRLSHTTHDNYVLPDGLEIGPYIGRYTEPFLRPMRIRLTRKQILGLKDNIEIIGGDLYLHGHRIIPID